MASIPTTTTATDSKSTPFSEITAFLASQDAAEEYGSSLAGDLTLVFASQTPSPKTILSFTVSRQHTNRSANLHGSCTAAVFQICMLTALALVTRTGGWGNLGAGRSQRVINLKPVEEGDGVFITSEVVGLGKRMCLIKGTMMRKSDGATVATCEMERVNLGAKISAMM